MKLTKEKHKHSKTKGEEVFLMSKRKFLSLWVDAYNMRKSVKSAVISIKLKEPCAYVQKFSYQYTKFMAYKRSILFESFFYALKNQFYKKSFGRQRLAYLTEQYKRRLATNIFGKMKFISSRRMKLYKKVVEFNFIAKKLQNKRNRINLYYSIHMIKHAAEMIFIQKLQTEHAVAHKNARLKKWLYHL